MVMPTMSWLEGKLADVLANSYGTDSFTKKDALRLAMRIQTRSKRGYRSWAKAFKRLAAKQILWRDGLRWRLS